MSISSLIKKIKFIVFDFDGVFTDNRVFINEKGEEAVACWRSDGLGLSKLRKAKIDGMILSTEKNIAVKKRAKKLKLVCVNGVHDKLASLNAEVEKRGLSLEEVAFVGNDINDADCLKASGFPIVVADAHKDIIRLGKYRTKALGGRGAVREICDLIYSIKGSKIRNDSK